MCFRLSSGDYGRRAIQPGLLRWLIDAGQVISYAPMLTIVNHYLGVYHGNEQFLWPQIEVVPLFRTGLRLSLGDELDAPPVGIVMCHSGIVQSHKKEKASMSEVSIIGVDLAKRVFHVHGALPDDSVAFRKKLSRSQFLRFLSEQPPCLIAMEPDY
jgi:hypothetical protein